jgi:hypothetical protein
MLVRSYLKKYKLTGDPALVLLGRIVNGADTDNTLYHRRRLPASRLQGRPRAKCGGVDRLRRALCVLRRDGKAGKPNGDFMD